MWQIAVISAQGVWRTARIRRKQEIIVLLDCLASKSRSLIYNFQLLPLVFLQLIEQCLAALLNLSNGNFPFIPLLLLQSLMTKKHHKFQNLNTSEYDLML
ncbi:hypothetical protein TorRG33x02_333340 [Trema orientale]|uniref:Uncharacterized protein n=1 Tax=Trema orientale TaxID=63057 RepID=A0A2P5B4F8_TREOI|nr:hypothetical protein TorRG33x02_333340 [Trema orientale]